MSTFTTTKLTKKQAHALLRTMSQSLNESEARGDDAQKALADAFGAPSGTGTPRDVLTRKLLGRLWRHPNPGTKAIGLRAYYRHEPAGARWGAIATSNKSTRTQPNIEDAWRGLHDLAQRYGVALYRTAGAQIVDASGSPAPSAQPAQPGVQNVAEIVQGGAAPAGQGTFASRSSASGKIRRAYTEKDRPSFPHAVALQRAFTAHTRAHEKRGEDGETLHRDSMVALSLGLREPMLAHTIRARSSVPAVQLYVDTSGSMGSPVPTGGTRADHAAHAGNAIIEACRNARAPVQGFEFDSDVQYVSDWSDRTWYRPRSGGGTDLPYALSAGLPLFAARPERRKIALVFTDGAVGYDTSETSTQPLTHWRRYADAHGIELYAIGLGVDVPHGPDTFHGSIRLDDPTELCSTAARELARVIGRGERVAV